MPAKLPLLGPCLVLLLDAADSALPLFLFARDVNWAASACCSISREKKLIRFAILGDILR